MSTEFTKTVDDNPLSMRILSLLPVVLFNIQGKCAAFRARIAHISGHLPLAPGESVIRGKLFAYL
jgi:hypothetical protein